METAIKVPQQLPFLTALCWQLHDVHRLTPEEMLHCYERGWHYRGVLADPDYNEYQFIIALKKQYGSWLDV